MRSVYERAAAESAALGRLCHGAAVTLHPLSNAAQCVRRGGGALTGHTLSRSGRQSVRLTGGVGESRPAETGRRVSRTSDSKCRLALTGRPSMSARQRHSILNRAYSEMRRCTRMLSYARQYRPRLSFVQYIGLLLFMPITKCSRSRSLQPNQRLHFSSLHHLLPRHTLLPPTHLHPHPLSLFRASILHPIRPTPALDPSITAPATRTPCGRPRIPCARA